MSASEGTAKQEFDDEVETGYKPPEKVGMDELMNKDADDEALMKWKQTLLAGAPTGNTDGPNVVVKSLEIISPGVDNLVMDVNSKSSLHFTVKEGASYRLKINFSVNNEIVPGLLLLQTLSRAKLPVAKPRFMLGSFGPKVEVQSWTSPEDTFPDGMVARGTYKVKSRFTDDDGNVIHTWSYELKIAKGWA